MKILIKILISFGLMLGISAADHNLWLSVMGLILFCSGVIIDNIINRSL